MEKKSKFTLEFLILLLFDSICSILEKSLDAKSKNLELFLESGLFLYYKKITTIFQKELT